MVFWVFGYGSLVWNPGFEYDEKIIGFIKGYRRVFDLGKPLHNMLDHLNLMQLSPSLRHVILFLQRVLIIEEHLKTQQGLAHWNRKKRPFV